MREPDGYGRYLKRMDRMNAAIAVAAAKRALALARKQLALVEPRPSARARLIRAALLHPNMGPLRLSGLCAAHPSLLRIPRGRKKFLKQ